MSDCPSTDRFEPAALALFLSDLAAAAPRNRFLAGQILYEPGDPAAQVFIVLQGQIRTHQLGPDGTQRLAEILGPGDWCGAAAVGRLGHYGERAISAAESAVAAIPIEHFSQELAKRPDAARELVIELARRLVAFRDEVAHMVFDDCNARLVRTLQRLSRSPAATHNGGVVTLHMTHQQLAAAVGAARETVSLALGELRRRNLLRTGRRELVFDPHRLSMPDLRGGSRVERSAAAAA
jgi:CRP-like cAMP-binding protein